MDARRFSSEGVVGVSAPVESFAACSGLTF